MVLFIMLYKVVLTIDSVNEILKCDHSNEIFVILFGFPYFTKSKFYIYNLFLILNMRVPGAS